jgi:hypothetical protein
MHFVTTYKEDIKDNNVFFAKYKSQNINCHYFCHLVKSTNTIRDHIILC